MCAAQTDHRQARHLSLDDLGAEGVARLQDGHALVIGVGGTGHAAAALLAAAGIGRLTLVDFDQVDTSNLARQTLYTPDDVGRDKVAVAAERLSTQNPAIQIDTHCARLSGDALRRAVESADVALDGTDNFGSRFALNAACVATRTALVSGSAIRWEGQVAVFGPGYGDGPCYRCLYQDDDESLDDCQGSGVVGPLPSIVGAMMALEAIKQITGVGRPLPFSVFDGRRGEWRQLALARRPDCDACGDINP